MNGIKKNMRPIGKNTGSGSTTRQKSLKVPSLRKSRTGTTKNDGSPSGFQEEPSSLLYSPKAQNTLTSAELSLRAKLLRPNKDGIVRISKDNLERLPKPPFDHYAFDAISDRDIKRAVAKDPDAAPIDMDWSNARMADPVRKIALSIRVDADVYNFFKSMGKNYQTRMNAVLRSFVDHELRKK